MKIDLRTEVYVKLLSEGGLTIREIVTKLSTQNLVVSRATVHRIINDIGKKRKLNHNKQKIERKRRSDFARKRLYQKVRPMLQTKDPLSIRAIAKKCRTSRSTIIRIKNDLNLHKRYKTKCHKLLRRHKRNRKTNSRKLYERHLSGEKSEFIVTLDEAYIYLTNCNGKRKICYIRRGENVPDTWVYEAAESFPIGFMVVGVLTGRGPLPLIKVPPKVKINSNYYINYVLKPLFDEHLVKLYPRDLYRVTLHHDKATSHTSNLTQNYLKSVQLRYGIEFIKNSEIPVKSPDISPLDFFGFSFLKQKLFQRRAKTVDGLWKVSKSEWSKISIEMVSKVFCTWKKRCRMVSQSNGGHIEQIKNIHNRRVESVLN